MKPKKFQFFLVALLILALALPAFGDYETRRQDGEIEDYEDHPWGGDSVDPGEPPINRLNPSSGFSPAYYLIELVRIFVLPGMDLDNLDEVDFGGGVLPQDFGDNNNRHNQKGQ